MTWGYLFLIVVNVTVVGESICYLHKYQVDGTIPFATYGECKRDGETLARKGFENYEIQVTGGCFSKEVLARD